ncbi:cysteine--tRNA ligase [Acidocella sp.]|uniref:cysteine--tRNA ligase n=1 Tax=Acidocella sp. TaxID=50710 RepID=UPI00262153DC|nr:cysteine--tRNA ligase [Acidocella sp.]
MTQLTLYNTRTRAKAPFTPLDASNVRAYLCGPTVYDRAHLGNARNVVIFDILIRLLRRLYPRVTYVRNITDIDDKINNRAKERGVSIEQVTEGPIRWYHEDMGALFTLPPDIEPRATDHLAEIIEIIERLIQNGHAYVAEGHVLFSVASDKEYGKFSGRTPDELIAGARVDIAPYKRDAGDFVLWKPSTPDLPGWPSPWGRGRPGWHIECSAMSWKHLGQDFDIHGGGDDLIFPHHENEIAQSCCAFPGSHFANVWVHNRMLLVNGEKMSKSLGNFLVLHDVLAKAPGEAVRFLLMRSHYRSTLDFSDAALIEARKELDRFYRALETHSGIEAAAEIPASVLEPLCDDLNTPGAIAALHALADAALAGDASAAAGLKAAGAVMGLFNLSPAQWFAGDVPAEVRALADARIAARKARDFAQSDRLRDEIAALGYTVEDGPNQTYKLRKS